MRAERVSIGHVPLLVPEFQPYGASLLFSSATGEASRWNRPAPLGMWSAPIASRHGSSRREGVGPTNRGVNHRAIPVLDDRT